MLDLSGLTRRFAGVVALDGVSLSIGRGEMHALAGENGAGKSTLIRLLAGIHRPDAGSMRLDGAPYAPGAPIDAIRAGVRVVHQELNLLPALSVAENLLFERLPRGRFGLLDRRALLERARALLDAVGLGGLDPRTRVERLGIAQCQLIEIARAIGAGGGEVGGGRVLILDEPTATLTPRESGRLFAQIEALKARGMTMLYVSHHLAEIFALCDRVSVLRNGRLIETLATAQTSPQALVRAMIGRTLATRPARAAPATAEVSRPPALELRGLRPRPAPSAGADAARDAAGIDLVLRYGEILGIAGLVGAGRTELLRAIFGADGRAGGVLLRDGDLVRIGSPYAATRAGIGLLTEDRKSEGLVLPMSAAVNTTLGAIGQVSRAGWLRRGAEWQACRAYAGELATRLSGPAQRVVQLSGGNQQKIVLAKWLMTGARVLMLDEPTRGIDVGAKAEIHALLERLARQGHALLVVSSELPELLHLCDRIVVLSRGRIAGSLERPDFSEEAVLTLAYRGFLGSPGTSGAPDHASRPSPSPSSSSPHVQ